jgi:copper chaperone CopZ
MEKIIIKLPAMYGDHHVMEVRRILLELPGVKEVYASSGFRLAEVTYDPAAITADLINASLGNSGYLGEIPALMESANAMVQGDGQISNLRHTVVYEQTRTMVSFSQDTAYMGRPLWPCPGMGVIKGMDKED